MKPKLITSLFILITSISFSQTPNPNNAEIPTVGIVKDISDLILISLW